MATSLHFLSLTPQTLYHHSSSASASASAAACGGPSLVTPSSLKPLSKFAFSLSSIGSYSHPNSRFTLNVSTLDEIEEGEEDDTLDFSGSQEQQSFSPKLKLFVGNLPFSVDSAGLAGLFDQAGNVQMVEVIYDKNSGRSRGFGFVTMSTTEEVKAAARQFDGYELEGRALRVNYGPRPSKRESYSSRGTRGGLSLDNTYKVHVGNLAWGVDNLTLETLFSEQGRVKEAVVVYDRESGRSRGFGFVTYSSPEEVENAVRSLDGIDVNGRSIRVSRAEARPRREFND